MIVGICCGATVLGLLLAVAWITVGHILFDDLDCDWGDDED